MGNEMTVYDVSQDITVSRPPEIVLEEATRAAKALGTVLAAKKKKVMMNGEQYLEFEDWQTVGRFYGVTAKVKETAFINYGGVQGFEAKAAAIRADGAEISAAEAMCLNDEEKWRARSKYKYLYILKDGSKVEDDPPKDQIVWIDNPDKPGKKMPKKERTLMGEEAVPLFQLRSMAQTRACAKVLRNVLAWVVVLAGYKPTVAEELDGQAEESGGDDHGDPPPVSDTVKKKPPTEGKEKTVNDTLAEELAAYCPDPAMRPALLKQITSFTDKDKKLVFADDISKMSNKWAGTAIGKLRELAKKKEGGDLPANCPKNPRECEHSGWVDGVPGCGPERLACSYVEAK
jgi:hypothetical protein